MPLPIVLGALGAGVTARNRDWLGRAPRNVARRWRNIRDAGGGLLEAGAAALTPNRTVWGADFYHMNPMVAAARDDNRQIYGPENPARTNNLMLQTAAGQDGLGAGTQPSFEGQWFDGIFYTNPEDLIAAKRQYLDETFADRLNQLRRQRGRGQEDFDTTRNQIVTALTDVLSDLDNQETLGAQNIGAYYSGLGDIYQSSKNIRKQQLRDEVELGRTRARDQKGQNINQLERAIQDYIGQHDVAERDLATQYQQALDNLANETDQTIMQRFNFYNPVAGQVGVNIQRQGIDTRSNINQLLPQNQRRFRMFGGGNRAQTQSNILNYLAGQS